MIRKNGLVIFECDRDSNGKEILNSTQRNNEIVWPTVKEKPKAQYRTTWKNTCNCTSMAMGLEYAGFFFPRGSFKQPEDNLALHILTSDSIRNEYKTKQPAMFDLFIKSLDGKCTERELKQMCFPTELHTYLSKGTNEWLGTNATQFSTNVNFPQACWKYMVDDNLPMVISTNFGGFGHIVCVTGVAYSEANYAKAAAEVAENFKDTSFIPNVIPEYIIVDDPWGDPSANNFEKYPAGGGKGNDIIVPWDIVVKKVKPLNSEKIKWAHTFNHAIATV